MSKRPLSQLYSAMDAEEEAFLDDPSAVAGGVVDERGGGDDSDHDSPFIDNVDDTTRMSSSQSSSSQSSLSASQLQLSSPTTSAGGVSTSGSSIRSYLIPCPSASSTPQRRPSPGPSSSQDASRSEATREGVAEDPYPYLAPMFTFVGREEKKTGTTTSVSVKYKCRMCPKGCLSASLRSKTNLKAHLAARHGKQSVSRYEKLCQNYKDSKRVSEDAGPSSSPANPGTDVMKGFFAPKPKLASQEEVDDLVRLSKTYLI